MLRHKMITLYGKDEDFTEVWDWVQTNDMCCGVDGPIDFLRINGKPSVFKNMKVCRDMYPSISYGC